MGGIGREGEEEGKKGKEREGGRGGKEREREEGRKELYNQCILLYLLQYLSQETSHTPLFGHEKTTFHDNRCDEVYVHEHVHTCSLACDVHVHVHTALAMQSSSLRKWIS